MFSTVISSIALTVSALIAASVILRPKFLMKRLKLNFFFRKEPPLIAVIAGGLILSSLDLCLGQSERLVSDMAVSALPVIVLPQSCTARHKERFSLAILGVELAAVTLSLLHFFGLFPKEAEVAWPLAVLVLSAGSFAFFFRQHLDRMKAPSDSLSRLSASALLSDVFYILFLWFLLLVSAMSCSITSWGHPYIAGCVDGLSFAATAALFSCSLLRRARSRHFLFFGKYEKMVSEAVQDCLGSRVIRADRKESLYRSVFSRVEEYFRSESPFLDSDLSINGVSERIFTNKVYVSRAISECADTNFCQYVNRYRVNYAMDCFRQNPSLRVSELAYMSGFRTVASYNMAFRRVVGEIPSDWMRRTVALLKRSSRGMEPAGAVAV